MGTRTCYCLGSAQLWFIPDVVVDLEDKEYNYSLLDHSFVKRTLITRFKVQVTLNGGA